MLNEVLVVEANGTIKKRFIQFLNSMVYPSEPAINTISSQSFIRLYDLINQARYIFVSLLHPISRKMEFALL
jgi:hypothetical protein